MATDVLRSTAHFRGLPPAEIDRLALAFTERRLEAGETLYDVGEPAEAIFVVAEGSVMIFRGLSGESRQPAARLCRGDVVGTADLFDSDRRSETAQATEESLVVGCPKADLLTFLEIHSRIKLNLRLAASRDLAARAGEALAVKQRRATRHRVNQEVVLTGAEIDSVNVTLVDLATLGLSLRGAPDDWQQESRIDCRLEWQDRRLDVRGRIAWREGDYVGIELDSPSEEQQTEILSMLESMLLSAI